MIVKCIATELSKDNIRSYGKRFRRRDTYNDLVIDEQYLVFAISVSFGSSDYGKGVFIDILNDADYLVSVPFLLFEIVDSCIPKDWVYYPWGHGNFSLCPAMFLRHEYFHQDLADQVPEVAKDFEELRNKYESEFLSQE